MWVCLYAHGWLSCEVAMLIASRVVMFMASWIGVS